MYTFATRYGIVLDCFLINGVDDCMSVGLICVF
jgi:hypothetical protein